MSDIGRCRKCGCLLNKDYTLCDSCIKIVSTPRNTEQSDIRAKAMDLFCAFSNAKFSHFKTYEDWKEYQISLIEAALEPSEAKVGATRLAALNEAVTSSKFPQQLLVKDLQHPCKDVCSGWRQGYEEGLRMSDKIEDVAEKHYLNKSLSSKWPTSEEIRDACQEHGFDSLDGENCVEWLKVWMRDKLCGK